jgi:hypothetical protein
MMYSYHARNGLLTLLCCVGPVVASQTGPVTPSHVPDLAQPSARYAAAANDQKLTISSTYGALLDNPTTKAILLKFAPEVVNNPQSQMGRELAFKDLAQYEPTLTSEKLQQIEAALSKAQEK